MAYSNISLKGGLFRRGERPAKGDLPLDDIISEVSPLFSKTNQLYAYQALGSSILSEPLSGSITNVTTTTNIVDGSIRFALHYVRKPTLFTGAIWYQITAGAYTADNYNGVGLYKVDPSSQSLILVASSTNDGDVWKATSSTMGKKAFSAQYTASIGVYAIGALWNNSASSTAPALGAHATIINVGASAVDFTNGFKLQFTYPGNATLPDSIAFSSTVVGSVQTYIALY